MASTFYVSSGGTGSDYKSITEAVKDAADGDYVVVRIGQYEERVILERSIHVMAEEGTDIGDVVIAGGLVTHQGGSVKNVAICQAVDIRGGDVLIENCDISLGSDGVRVFSGAEPTIFRCQIHGAQQGGDGIYFQEGSRGTVEECDIYGNRVNGIHVNGGDVVVRKNRVRECPYGIYYRRGARGVVEANRIENVTYFGIYIIEGADPAVSKNTVINAGVHCVMISQGGAGNVQDNTVQGSVRILKGCAPVLGTNSVSGRLDNENNPMAGMA